MSFRMLLDARGRKSSRFISKVHEQLQRAFVRHYEANGTTQQKLAEKLGVDRSFVNRKLSGEGNLTLRTIADFAWALDCDVDFELVPTRSISHNYEPDYADLGSISSGPALKSVGKSPPTAEVQAQNGARTKTLIDA